MLQKFKRVKIVSEFVCPKYLCLADIVCVVVKVVPVQTVLEVVGGHVVIAI